MTSGLKPCTVLAIIVTLKTGVTFPLSTKIEVDYRTIDFYYSFQ